MNKEFFKNPFSVILIILILSGFIWRLYHISAPSYWIDEAYSINASETIYQNGYPLLATGEIYKNGLLNSYLMTFSSWLVGKNELGYRLISVLVGTLLIPLVFFAGRLILKSNLGALAASFFIAFSYWEMLWSRQARGYILLQFFYLLGFYYVFRLLEKFNRRDFIFFLLCGIFAYFSHFLGIILIPLGLAALALKYIKNIKLEKIRKLKRIDYFIIFLILAGGIFLAIFNVRLSTTLQNSIPSLLLNYFAFLLLNHFFITLTCCVGLLFLLISRKRSNQRIFFFFALALPFLLIFSTTEFLQFRYLFFLYPLMVILSILIILKATEFIKTTWLKSIIVLAFIIIPNFNSLVLIPQTNYGLEPLTPQPDFKNAYQAINDIKTENDIIISPYAPLDKIYFGKSDYWLMISLTGKSSELKKYENFPFDIYCHSPAVKNFTQLQEITSFDSGFLLLDEMAVNRIGPTYFKNIQENFTQIYFKDDGVLKKIWVFQF